MTRNLAFGIAAAFALASLPTLAAPTTITKASPADKMETGSAKKAPVKQQGKRQHKKLHRSSKKANKAPAAQRSAGAPAPSTASTTR